jgi:hypothetical protein
MTEESPTPGGEHTSGVLGVAFGLFLLLSLLLGILSQRASKADAPALLSAWFEVGELPFGLEVDSAVTQARGEEVVLLSRPDAPEETPRAERPEGEDDDEDEEDDSFDWSTIPIGPEGTPPLAVMVIHYPKGLAESELTRLFETGGDRWDDDDEMEMLDVGSEGGRTVMERGRLPWQEYSTSFIHERELEYGGTFRDAIRVNVSLPKRACVIFVRWPRGFPGSKDDAKEVLAAFKPRPDSL